jgi:hypothetical protein
MLGQRRPQGGLGVTGHAGVPLLHPHQVNASSNNSETVSTRPPPDSSQVWPHHTDIKHTSSAMRAMPGFKG